MNLDELITTEEVLERELQDPDFRAEWERTGLARWLAIEVAHYRAQHDLSQRQLADRLGIKQPQIARIEIGEHMPSFGTLSRLARGLNLELMIDIHPEGHEATLSRKRAGRASSFTFEGCEVLVAAATA
jgi:ribosome-binding protein aMBF1 (putative translation factor)